MLMVITAITIIIITSAITITITSIELSDGGGQLGTVEVAANPMPPTIHHFNYKSILIITITITITIKDQSITVKTYTQLGRMQSLSRGGNRNWLEERKILAKLQILSRVYFLLTNSCCLSTYRAKKCKVNILDERRSINDARMVNILLLEPVSLVKSSPMKIR